MHCKVNSSATGYKMKVSNMAIDMGRFLILFTSLFDIICVGAQSSMDSCERSIWDNKSDMPEIRNVVANCVEGSVTWNSPHGALRVALQFQTPSQPFRGCIKASAQYTVAKISRIVNGNLEVVVTLSGANSNMKKEICFDSTNGEKIVLFIEASTGTATSSFISISYELDKLTSTISEDDMEECRPCSDEELLESVCSSDLVVVGTIQNVQTVEHHDESEIQLLARKIYRQKSKQFKRDTKTRGRIQGTVVAPLKCGVHSGEGEFLITGKIRLGRTFLQCAPRIEDWNRLKTEALRTGIIPCSLDD